jgi:hypothetical protein
MMALVQHVSRYGRRLRRAWRVLWIEPQDVPEEPVESDGIVSRKPKAACNDDARKAIRAVNGMIESAKYDIEHVIMHSGCYDPVGESDRTIERVNNFRLLRGNITF